MTLLGKLERLERIAAARRKSEKPTCPPELLDVAERLLAEAPAKAAAWAQLPLHEKIAELRRQIEQNQADDEPEPDDWREMAFWRVRRNLKQAQLAQLARLEAEYAKLQ